MYQFYNFVLNKLDVHICDVVRPKIVYNNFELYENYFKIKQFDTYKLSNKTYNKKINVNTFDEDVRITYNIYINDKSCILLFYTKATKSINLEGIIYNKQVTQVNSKLTIVSEICVSILENYMGYTLIDFVIKFIRQLGCVDYIETSCRTFKIYNKKNINTCPMYMILYGETLMEHIGFVKYNRSKERVMKLGKDNSIVFDKKVKEFEQSIKKVTHSLGIQCDALIELCVDYSISDFFRLLFELYWHRYDDIMFMVADILQEMGIHMYYGDYVMYLSNGKNMVDDIEAVCNNKTQPETKVDCYEISEEEIISYGGNMSY